MKQDACYKNLEVKNNIVAQTIYAKQIKLEDTTLESNILMLGEEIKKMYERQHNTNAYTDSDKEYLNMLTSLVSLTSQCIQFAKPTFFPICDKDVEVPCNSYCICKVNNEIVYKINKEGTILYCPLLTKSEKVDVDFSISEENVEISLNTIFT